MTTSSPFKVVAKRARNKKRKSNSKGASQTARHSHRKTTTKVAAKELLATDRKASAKVFAEKVRATRRQTAAQFEELAPRQVGRPMADKSAAEMRELHEHPADAFQAVVESWENSFGAAGHGVVALNQAIIDIAQRNIKTSFALRRG